MADIFLSYSHQDSQIVNKVERALADRHVPVWSDQRIRAGADWMPEIEKALSEAKVFVLCLSPDFLALDWANFEIGVALTRSRDSGTQVIPLLVRDSPMPKLLGRFPYLDARNTSADQIATAIQKAAESGR